MTHILTGITIFLSFSPLYAFMLQTYQRTNSTHPSALIYLSISLSWYSYSLFSLEDGKINNYSPSALKGEFGDDTAK